MEQVKITRIMEGKSGTTNGKAWSKIGIYIESKPETWINGFANDQTSKWEVGSIVNLDITEDPKWGFQFKLPKTSESLVNLTKRVDSLEESINKLLRAVNGDVKQEELPPDEDLPF